MIGNTDRLHHMNATAVAFNGKTRDSLFHSPRDSKSTIDKSDRAASFALSQKV